MEQKLMTMFTSIDIMNLVGIVVIFCVFLAWRHVGQVNREMQEETRLERQRERKAGRYAIETENGSLAH